jgi:translation initiation factor 2B subunit (eIF-2B alpha/beta/delta family)
VGRAVAVATREFPPDAQVMTLSRGETVRRTLTALRRGRRPRRIRVLRSEPGGEGARLVEELRQVGLVAEVLDDAQGVREVGLVDLVLVGADAVYRGGALVHKVGTRALASAAAQVGVPVLSVTGLSKFVDRAPPSPRALPALFDLTPGRSLGGFWTDAGFRRPEEMRGRPERRVRRSRALSQTR